MIILTGTYNFFILTISDELIGLYVLRLNAPTSTIRNGDGEPSGCLSVWQQVSDTARSVRETGRRPGRPIGESEQRAGRSGSVSASDQCISSVSTTESSPAASTRIDQPGYKVTAVVLSSFNLFLKTISKILNSVFAYKMFCTFFKLSRSALSVQVENKYTLQPRDHITPQLSGPADGRHGNQTTCLIS